MGMLYCFLVLVWCILNVLNILRDYMYGRDRLFTEIFLFFFNIDVLVSSCINLPVLSETLQNT